MPSNNVRRDRPYLLNRSIDTRALASRLVELLPVQGVKYDQDAFANSILKTHLLAKFCDPDPLGAKSRSEKAYQKWYACEERCGQVNISLISDLQNGGVYDVFHVARRKIADLLGPFSLSLIGSECDFGPGATTLQGRSSSDKAYKFQQNLDCTSDAIDLLGSLFKNSPMWFNHLEKEGLVINNFSRTITVPKNSEIDRVISIEPSLNMYVQKGIGRYIRSRLKKVSIDLDDQGCNQHFAKLASLGAGYSTLDLSSASDTISYRLVREILPWDWSLALEMVRTPNTVVNGKPVTLQKWSAMGNGYTFELESLIFWALMRAAVDSSIVSSASLTVYGDDIIIPRAAADLCVKLLTLCGFTVNEEKSHIDGPYHESCGKHFYEGCDVTPFFIRRPIKTVDDVFLFHNNLVRWMTRQQYNLSLNREALVILLEDIRDLVCEGWRKPRLPDGYGDGAFIGTFDQATPTPLKSRRKPFVEGFKARVIAEQTVETFDFGIGLLLRALHELEGRDYKKAKWKGQPLDPRRTSSCNNYMAFHNQDLQSLSRGVVIKTRKRLVDIRVHGWNFELVY